MKWLFSLFVLSLLWSELAFAQASAPHYDPAPSRSNPQSKGLVDFALSRLNPQNTDYGQCIEDARRIAIRGTLENYYFWSNLIALSAGFGLFLYAVHLKRGRQQILLSTARILAEYQNQLATGNDKFHQMEREYSQFLRELEQLKEPRFASKSSPPKARSSNGNSPDSGSASKTASVAVAPHATPSANGDYRTLKEENSIVRQENARLKETNTNQQATINSLMRQLGQERDKNRKVRGE